MREEVCTALPHRSVSQASGTEEWDAHHAAASKKNVTPETDASSPARQPSARYTSETEWPPHGVTQTAQE